MGLVEFSLCSIALLEGVCRAELDDGGSDELEVLETVCREDLLLLLDDATRL